LTACLTRCKLQLNTYVLKTWIKNTFLFSLLLQGIWSCEKPPDFDKKPLIEFNEISNIRTKDVDLDAFVDSLTISLKFKDGDGDLGVEKSDIGNIKYRAFSDTIIDSKGNKSFVFRNYYTKAFRKDKGEYKEVESYIKLGGTFNELISYDEVGPIEGVLNYGFKLLPNSAIAAGFKNNDTVKFQVYIMDRALNVSNTVFTDSIVLFKK
jgi:hypothetical protein